LKAELSLFVKCIDSILELKATFLFEMNGFVLKGKEIDWILKGKMASNNKSYAVIYDKYR